MIESSGEIIVVIARLLHLIGFLLNVGLFPFTLYLCLLCVCPFLKKIKKKSRPLLMESNQSKGQPIEFTFVIPAHNEEAGISETVRSCLDVSFPAESFNVVVIADNCTDRTAQNALKAGAQVLERFDTTKKSKGYALEWYFEREVLQGSSDSSTGKAFTGMAQGKLKGRAFVIVDADSVVSKNLLSRCRETA